MKNLKIYLIFVFVCCNSFVSAQSILSPDLHLKVTLQAVDGSVYYSIFHDEEPIILKSDLGIRHQKQLFFKNLKIERVSKSVLVKDTYSSKNSKKSNITYQANRREFYFSNRNNEKMSIIFQVSNDGVAFSYHFPKTLTGVIEEEFTSFHFPKNTTAFLQPKAKPQTGWCNTNPSYEENYQQNIPVGTTTEIGWVYPALFKVNKTWVLASEAGMDGSYCGTHLKNTAGSSVYKIGFPEPVETFKDGDHLPKDIQFTPWRFLVIGSLKTIAESTLGTDLAPKADDQIQTMQPGKSSWSWIMSGDPGINYEEQMKYIDMAASLHWEYCLIDVNWDSTIGFERLKTLVNYAKERNVSINVWYNSSGPWNTTIYSPKSKLLTQQSRLEEFKKLADIGVKGIKVDFFNGDGRSMIQYYIDILKDASKFNLMVNFHGSTLPRGMARTYPNMVSSEAIKGFEMFTFDQKAADQEATHCTLLPFTRNAFDPMDFTPMNLYKINTDVKRKTTAGFELATSVMFLSGIQHFAESPEGMAKVPEFVKDYLQKLPANWDDVKFIDGYPGKFVVMARRSGNRWFISGMNGETSKKSITLNLASFHKNNIQLITDGDETFTFIKKTLKSTSNYTVEMKPEGGFIIILD